MQHRLASDQDNDEPNRINTVIANIVNNFATGMFN